jgi:hypothetical protein
MISGKDLPTDINIKKVPAVESGVAGGWPSSLPHLARRSMRAWQFDIFYDFNGILFMIACCWFYVLLSHDI